MMQVRKFVIGLLPPCGASKALETQTTKMTCTYLSGKVMFRAILKGGFYDNFLMDFRLIFLTVLGNFRDHF